MWLRIAILLTLSGCSHALTDNAVVLVDQDSDIDLADGSLEEFRPHIGVSVTVTKDPKVFHSWNTEERWKIVSVTEPQYNVAEARLCDFGPDGKDIGTFAVTQYSTKTVFMGACAPTSHSLRPIILAHEIGHLVGASDCSDGVMQAVDPTSFSPSQATINELRKIY